ncbi:formate/nitrite transporter family protein [Spiroplasma turonicum]|uniref:Formate/nitrite transporter n=1 Tax=Spiroplasma turonicum TaxID=216946 RepID=A0A0K1P8D7_9MOLU|nr:formate/nitrite transporter family protein [Spiroplasma turonicum]AKU80162.1 formate/nitrite transporter [Spiroplasma turonicum]ALX71162.1 formate/nitrite transporter [Spiroplasma turonicum]
MSNKLEKIELEIDELKKHDYSILEGDHSFMLCGTLGGFKASIKKIQYTMIKQILLGLMSGVIIGFGYVACLTTMKGLPPNLEALVLGAIFPGCIILITFLGGALFTSHSLATIPMMKGCLSFNEYIKAIVSVLLGNFLGTFLFSLLYVAAGAFHNTETGSVAEKIYTTGIHKLYGVGDNIMGDIMITTCLVTIVYSFFSGILCNLAVSATLPLTSATKSPTSAILLLIFPILYFAIGGFQHGPANSFFLWMMLLECIFKQKWADNSVLKPEFFHILLFVLLSTLPTLLGNWVGGSFLMAGILHSINKKYTSMLFMKMRLERLEKTLLISRINVNKIESIKKREKTIVKK